MQENRSKCANDYINLIIRNGTASIITIPTRVIATSSTLLDHIITNNMDQVISPAVIETDITDHYPILCTVNKPRYSTSKFTKKFCRDESSFFADSFRNDLQADLYNAFSHQPELTEKHSTKSFISFLALFLPPSTLMPP